MGKLDRLFLFLVAFNTSCGGSGGTGNSSPTTTSESREYIDSLYYSLKNSDAPPTLIIDSKFLTRARIDWEDGSHSSGISYATISDPFPSTITLKNSSNGTISSLKLNRSGDKIVSVTSPSNYTSGTEIVNNPISYGFEILKRKETTPFNPDYSGSVVVNGVLVSVMADSYSKRAVIAGTGGASLFGYAYFPPMASLEERQKGNSLFVMQCAHAIEMGGWKWLEDIFIVATFKWGNFSQASAKVWVTWGDSKYTLGGFPKWLGPEHGTWTGTFTLYRNKA